MEKSKRRQQREEAAFSKIVKASDQVKALFQEWLDAAPPAGRSKRVENQVQRAADQLLKEIYAGKTENVAERFQQAIEHIQAAHLPKQKVTFLQTLDALQELLQVSRQWHQSRSHTKAEENRALHTLHILLREVEAGQIENVAARFHQISKPEPELEAYDDTIQEITPTTWQDKPVIATFSGSKWLVGMNGIAALNYEELEEEARALVEPIYDRLLMKDLGLEEGEDGEVTLTISLDDDMEEVEDEQDAAGTGISGHNFFTCPEALAKRAIFLRVGMRVRGRYTSGEQVAGEISGGNWSYVTVRDEDAKEHPSVPVHTLEVLA
jgi:hypothetical protein